MKKFWQVFLVLLLGTGLVLSGIPAVYGQEDDEEEEKDVFTLDEVIVTATKREESVLEVPLTVSAFNSQTIEQLGMISMDDLNMLAPGLQIGEEADLKDQGWVIRGIGSRLWGENHSDLAVAFYVDGVYQYAPMGMAPSMFDIDRVEVARGPQGTLHGRNSIAGSVSFFNKKPTDEWDLDLVGEWTSIFTQRYGLAFGGPLFGGLSFRLTGHYLDGQGSLKNIGMGEDMDQPNDVYTAAALRYKSDRFDIYGRYSYAMNKGTPRQMLVLDSIGPRDIFNVWDNAEGAEQNYNHWYMYTKDNPFPATEDCDLAGLQYTTRWADSYEGWVPGKTRYYYFNACDDLKDVVNQNDLNISETLNESGMLSFDWHVLDWLSVRYVVGQSRLRHEQSREVDKSNREGGWEGPLWHIHPWDNYLETNRDQLSKDAGVHFWQAYYTNPYNLTQSSNELVLFSDFDGPFNFIIGAFYYQNETVYEHSNYYPKLWFRYRDAADDFATVLSWMPHWWGLAGYAGSELPDAGPNGEYPNTHAGCNELMWDIATAGNYAVEYGVIGYECMWNEGDHLNNWRFWTGAKQETKAIYGHVGWQFNDQWSISGGIRSTEDAKKKVNEYAWGGEMWAGVLPIRWTSAPPFPEPRSWDDIIWDVSLEYSFREGMMAYGRVAKGYRAGSFQSWIYEPGITVPEVDSETLINYEVGVKGTTLDQRLWFTAGAFYSPYDGFQIDMVQSWPKDQVIPPTANSPLLDYVANIDDTKIWGAEIEGAFNLTERWRFAGYYIYMDSEIGPHSSVTRGDPNRQQENWYTLWTPNYNCTPWKAGEPEGTHCGAENDYLSTGAENKDFDINVAQLPCIGAQPCWGQTQYQLPTDKTGNQLAMQPNHKWSITASYTMPLENPLKRSVSLGNLMLLGTYSYTGLRHPYIANIPAHEMPAYAELNIRAIWWSDSGRWSATLWVANALDEKGLISFTPSTIGWGGDDSTGLINQSRRAGFIIRYKL